MKTILITLALAAFAQAEIVKLAWDANPVEEKVTSYIVSYGTTTAMTQSLTVTTNAATTPDLPPGVYYFAVRAVNERGLQSPQSPSITHTVLPAPTAPLPTPTAPLKFRVVIEANVTIIPAP